MPRQRPAPDVYSKRPGGLRQGRWVSATGDDDDGIDNADLATRQLMTPEQLNQLVDRCMANAATLYGAKVGSAPEVRLDLTGQAAGQAIGGKQIRLNQPLLDANPDQWEATVIHELAHVITWRLYPRARAHGWQWREINHALGGTGQVCHQMDTRPYRARTLSYYCYRTARGGEVWLSSIRHRRAQKNLRRWGGTGYLTAKGDPIEYWMGQSRRGSPAQQDRS